MTQQAAIQVAINAPPMPLSVAELQSIVDSLSYRIEEIENFDLADDDCSDNPDDLKQLRDRLSSKLDAIYGIGQGQASTSDAKVTPKAYPLNHRYYQHIRPQLNEALSKWLEGWYEIADQLKTMPAGTQARLEEDGKFVGTLVLAPLNGELYMFWASPGGLDGEPKFCSLGGPQNRALSPRAGTYIKNAHLMSKWLANPQFDAPIDTKHLAAVVSHYYQAESDESWVWDGNAPARST